MFCACVTKTTGLSRDAYGPIFKGDGTYYGFTTDGNCAIRPPVPNMYSGMVPVAINNAQYAGSLACGACLEVEGTGRGLGANPIRGKFKAFVMDRCPECKFGDLDLSASGDGRWEIKWRFVKCPGEAVSLLFEGSNAYYWKLQPRGSKTPIKKAWLNGMQGSRSQDNFFVFRSGSGIRTPAILRTQDIFGEEISNTLREFKSDGIVRPPQNRVMKTCVKNAGICNRKRNKRCCNGGYKCKGTRSGKQRCLRNV